MQVSQQRNPGMVSSAGPDYAIDLATRPKLTKWLEVVMAVDAVKATLAEPEALCGTYKRYADNTALSKVGVDNLKADPEGSLLYKFMSLYQGLSQFINSGRLAVDVLHFQLLSIFGPKWCPKVAEAVRQGKTADSV